MADGRTRVGLARRGNRRENVFAALDLVRDDVIPKLRAQVMLKPNLFSSKSQLTSTHADAIRGALDFLMTVPDPPEEVLIAEGANEKVPGEAFQNFGYTDLDDEYPIPIRLVDLHKETEWVEATVLSAERNEVPVRLARVVVDCPCTISVAVAKTHDACVVTLALKNVIVGALHKEDRVKIHGYPSHRERELPREAQTLSINLIRMSRHLCPDIGVIDGTVGVQGNGPGGKDAVALGIAAAGADVFATDAVMAAAMGFEPLQIGFLHYANELGYGTADLGRIKVLETPLADAMQRVKPHEKFPLQLQWREAGAMQYLQV